MSLSNFFPKKASSPFNVRDIYLEWYETLTREYLPLLTSAASATCTVSDDEITAMLNHVFTHLVSYYETLERSADHSTISHLFSTSWLNSHETPFLFLGNIHPYLFTNLLRSFIHPEVQDSSDAIVVEFDNPWKNPSEELKTRLSMIELRTTMNVPALLERMRTVERSYVVRVSKTWISSHHEKRKTKSVTVDEGLTNDELEALLEIFVETNRLIKSVICSIDQALNLPQKTKYLEALFKIFVGLNDHVRPHSSSHDAADSKKRDNKVLSSNFVNGVVSVPSFFLLIGKMTSKEIDTARFNFAARTLGAAGSSFVSAMLKRRGLFRSTQDSLWAFICFLSGGLIPMIVGLTIESRVEKFFATVVITAFLIGVVIVWDYKTREDETETQQNSWLLWVFTMLSIAAGVGAADIINHL